MRESIGIMHTKFGPIWMKTAEFYRVFSYLAMKNIIFFYIRGFPYVFGIPSNFAGRKICDFFFFNSVNFSSYPWSKALI